MYLAIAYDLAGDEGAHYIEGLQRAFDLRDRISERERLWVACDYYYYVMQDSPKARESAELWMLSYPRDGVPHTMLGNAYMREGRIENALREHQQSYEMGGMSVAKWNIANALVRLNRFDEAKVFVRKELARNPNDIGLRGFALKIALIQADGPSESTETEWFSRKSVVYLANEIQATTRFVLGQRRGEEELLRQADEQRARLNLVPSSVALLDEDAVTGTCDSTHRAKKPSAVALALCGQAPQVAATLKAVEDAARNRPFDTRIPMVDLPLTRAAASLAQNHPETAIEQLRSMGQAERIHPEGTYLRGLAYLRLRKGAEAATEFQKILDHKGVSWGPFYPVSYVGVARAAALAGDVPRARKAYQDFLALWKDADPEIPILKNAKAEYAKL